MVTAQTHSSCIVGQPVSILIVALAKLTVTAEISNGNVILNTFGFRAGFLHFDIQKLDSGT
jgi:hypothetical protein